MRRGAVIAPNWVGDAVMCLPALHALAAALPSAALTVLSRASVFDVFAAAQLPASIVRVPNPSFRQALAAVFSKPTDYDFDCALVFPNSFYSALLAHSTRGKLRIGYAHDARSFLLTHALRRPGRGETPSHESFYYLELLRGAGVIDRLPETPVARLYPKQAEIVGWRKRLDSGGSPLVAVHAGATFGTAKRWLPQRFAELAARLAAEGAVVLFIGSPSERALADWVISLTHADRAINLAGQTSLAGVIDLLAAVDVLICNDSGPMHLAAAVGTPVVAIFGSTNEKETFPLAANEVRLIKAPGVGCSPCKLRDCPIDHRCMTRITVEEVLAATRQIMPSAVIHRQ
jgi:heptosyltransferase-2